VPSAESTRAASRDRRRQVDANLRDARAGTDRNRNRADVQLEPSYGDPPRSAGTPNTSQAGRP
jgi:hypothetical protein